MNYGSPGEDVEALRRQERYDDAANRMRGKEIDLEIINGDDGVYLRLAVHGKKMADAVEHMLRIAKGLPDE